jgi:WD40 repeat protein
VAFLVQHFPFGLDGVIGRVSDGSVISVGTGGSARSIALSRDGQILAVNILDGSQIAVNLYRTSDGALTRTLTGYTDQIQSLAFSPDGALLASGSANTIQVWRLQDFLLLYTIQAGATSQSLAFSPDSQLLASGHNSSVRLWNVSDGSPIVIIPQGAYSLDFTTDGQWLVAGGNDGRLSVSSVPDGNPFPNPPGHTGAVTAVAFSPDGTMVATASQDHTIKLRNTTSGTVIGTLTGHTDSVNSLAFSPDGTVLVSGSSDRTVRLWRMPDFVPLRTLTGHTQPVRAVSFSLDGSMIASGSDSPEQLVKLWTASGDFIQDLTGSSGGVTSIAFTGAGSVAAGGQSGIARVWDPVSGTVIHSYLAPTNGPMSLSFSPDGLTLAAGWTTKILLFNVDDTTPFRIIDAHTMSGTVVACSLDGLRLISANPDGTVKLWNTADWSLVAIYNQETYSTGSGVLSVVFSPDGTQFAYGRGDATVVLAATPQ